MSLMFENIKNTPALRYFEAISAIPRPSYHEKAVADYIVAFAAERGLDCYRDEAHNVLVKMPATKGREDEPTVLLQAHTDMVAEKHPHVEHDFLRDGIELCIEGNRLLANGTTLGADDGFGVAMMLAILDGGAASHPALECLFTAAEEVGLLGAERFDYSYITAKYMVNLDSAEEDTVIVGCCGGMRSKIILPITFGNIEGEGITLLLGGLSGGHSGEDIHRNRLNANILMGKLLAALREHTPYRLVEMTGGDKGNAIPRDCTATFLPDDGTAARAFLEGAASLARSFIVAKEDEGLFLKVEGTRVTHALSYPDTDRILRVLEIPNGVLQMRSEAPIMPEVSRNLASVRTHADRVVISLCSRSPRADRLDDICREEDALAKSVLAIREEVNRYPGWVGDMNAPLVQAWQHALLNVTGKSASPTFIHAGLETGIITNSIAGLEAIAVGPNLHDLHTPFEAMEIDSFLRVYDALVEFLRIVNR